MLLQEGTSKGNEPTVSVLEITRNPERKADDLLPYLSPYAKFFRRMPKNERDYILKPALIPLSNVECLTRTLIDIPETVRNLRSRKGTFDLASPHDEETDELLDTLKLAQDQFKPLCSSWDYEDWDEYDFGRIKNLAFRELDEARRKKGQEATNRVCLTCPDFLKHVSGVCIKYVKRQADEGSSPWSTTSGSSKKTYSSFGSSCQTRICSYCPTTSSGYRS